MKGVLAVAFDYGRVLSGPQIPEAVERMHALTGLARDSFEAHYRRERLPYDRGTISSDAYWRGILERAGTPFDDALIQKLMDADAESWSGADMRVVELAERIAARGTKIAILSNMPADVLARLRKKHAWIAHFPIGVFSCDVGVVKPDREIYDCTVQQLGVAAEQVLFIDDHPANIEGAKRAGMQTILYERFEQLGGVG